ncbi:hypothetical protein ANRL3_02095 [Anaerolineae bacterium]|nr:hypothetical protein ANRL3_02095 [Anaerolineae bacterium]
MRGQFRSNDNGTVAVILFITGLLIAAFIVGAVALDRLQWLHSDIGPAFAQVKTEEAREKRLNNDRLEEQNRLAKIDNDHHFEIARLETEKRQAQDTLQVEQSRAWTRNLPNWIGLVVAALSDVLRWIPVVVIAYLVIRQPGGLTIPSIRSLFGNSLRPALARVRTFNSSVQTIEADESDSEPNTFVVVREQTAEEKERNRAQRDQAKQRERDGRFFTQRRVA